MIHFMKTFKQSELQLIYPCTMLTLIQKMCEVCGVGLYSTDFFNADLQVDEDYLFQLKYDSFCNIDLICFYRPIIL